MIFTRAVTVQPSRVPPGNAARGDATPEVPDAIATLADREARLRGSLRHESSAWGRVDRYQTTGLAGRVRRERADVVVQDYVLAIDAAGESRRGNFHFRRFVAGDAVVRDRNSPQQRGFKVVWWSDWVHVACFVTSLFRDARIVGDDESERTRCLASRRDHCNCRASSFVWDERDEFFREKQD